MSFREAGGATVERWPGDDPIVDDSRYEQARACGWDALDKSLCRPAAGQPGIILEPVQSPFWHWWTIMLEPSQRRQLVALSRGVAASNKDGVGLAPERARAIDIDNPLFENDARSKALEAGEIHESREVDGCST